jgi:type IX secretion system PorP/SprF family membrane protein
MQAQQKFNHAKEITGHPRGGYRHPFFILAAIMIISLSWHFSAAQLIPYSQYYNSPVLTNPAEAASGDFIQLGVHYRKSRVANYETPSLSFIHPFYRNRDDVRFGGAGFNLINQKAGPGGLYNTTALLGTFAYIIHFSKSLHVGAGLQGGMIYKKIDLMAITTDHQFNLGAFDPSLPNGENIQFSAASSPVINSGFTWMLTDNSSIPKAQLGIAFSNMNRPAYEFMPDNRKGEKMTYTITGAVKLLAHRSISIHPMFRYIGGTSSFVHVGAQFHYRLREQDNDLRAGFWYKTTQALVTAVQYSTSNYIIAASMDFTSNDTLQANINNAFELSLNWRLKRKNG